MRQWDAPQPFQILAGQRSVDPGGGSEIHDPAALFAGTGAEVNQVVAFADNLRIVLDHDNRIGAIPQVFKDVRQAVSVAGVQADTRFIQDIEGIDQGGTKGRGQSDPLHLAAGEGSGLAVQGQIGQSNVFKVFQAVVDFFQNQLTGFIPLGQLKAIEKGGRCGHIHRIDLGDGAVGQAVEEGFGLEARALAIRASVVAPIAR